MNELEFSERAMACAERLWRISYLILRNPADCDDAVQEALMRGWTGLGKLRSEEYFETWLVRILINVSRNMLKRRRLSVELNENLADEQPPDTELRDAIRMLEMKYRMPLILHHLEGYSLEDCARMLRLPVSTVKGRLFAARRQLRSILDREDEV